MLRRGWGCFRKVGSFLARLRLRRRRRLRTAALGMVLELEGEGRNGGLEGSKRSYHLVGKLDNNEKKRGKNWKVWRMLEREQKEVRLWEFILGWEIKLENGRMMRGRLGLGIVCTFLLFFRSGFPFFLG